MIYGLPKLYKDELFISGLSRFSAYLGIHRDFTFMNLLYDCTPQYPSFSLTTNLKKLNSKLDLNSKVDKDKIIRSHTMFSLHSHFVEDKVKNKAYDALFEGHSLFLAISLLGFKSKFIYQDNRYKYCFLCIQEMKENYGQYYWKRLHQVVGVEVCVKHNCMLLRSSASIHKNDRYLLNAASPDNCNSTYSSLSGFENFKNEMEFNLNVARLINEVFKLPDKKPPTRWQWTHFYRDLANENGLIITEKLILDRATLISRLDEVFKFSWLAKKSVNQKMEIYNRVLLIFYKHNFAFNYLIHIFIWVGFHENPIAVELFDRVSQYPDYKMHSIGMESFNTPTIYELKNNRIRWKKILQENSKKDIKYILCELYLELGKWFSKHDKEWFNTINNVHDENLKPKKRKKYKARTHTKARKKFIRNWLELDSDILNTLKQIHAKHYENINSKRQSKCWHIKQTRRKLIELHHSNLPTSMKFLHEYSETVQVYQIRRLSNSLLNFDYSSKTTITTLLNANNLFKNQIQNETKQFVEWITPYFSKFATMPKDAADNYFGFGFEIDEDKYPELKALLNSKAACRLNFILRLFGGLINTDGEQTMLYGFPIIYKDELLYSVLARYYRHMGLQNYKRYMEILYQDRNVQTSYDLHSHIAKLEENVSSTTVFDSNQIITHHTFFPLYAPFITQKRKKSLHRQLLTDTGDSAHARVGLASKLNSSIKYFKYCPKCMSEMKNKHGEYYWKRNHQIKGIQTCSKHRILLHKSTVCPNDWENRQHYYSATDKNCNIENPPKNLDYTDEEIDISLKFSDYITQILELDDFEPPSYWQWTHFYHFLAEEQGALKGRFVDQHLILNKLKNTKYYKWFKKHIINDDEYIESMTKNILRKHRKSFHYLNHILIWISFSDISKVSDIFNKIKQYPDRKIEAPKNLKFDNLDPKLIKLKRNTWLNLISKYKSKGVKYIRSNNGALYAWLYRHDKQWLVETNQEYHLKRSNHSNIDWKSRDKLLFKKLQDIYENHNYKSQYPRHSKKWFISQLYSPSSIEKNLNKLPLCYIFLKNYSESIAMYQIRRISHVITKNGFLNLNIPNSLLERQSGLNQQRMCIETKQFITWIRNNYQQISQWNNLDLNNNDSKIITDLKAFPQLNKLLRCKAHKRIDSIINLLNKTAQESFNL